MSPRYRISSKGGGTITDAEIARHRDAGRLLYNYHQAVRPLYKRPLYKDPKAFIALLIIVLIAIVVSEELEKRRARVLPQPSAPELRQQP